MTKRHMTKPEFIILSAELSTRTYEGNRQATLNLISCLDDLGLAYKPVQGCYKGSTEQSFIVMTPDEDTMEAVKNLGLKNFKQESVLFRDYTGACSLHYVDRVESLGSFKEVEENEVLMEDAYTIIDGRYFIVK